MTDNEVKAVKALEPFKNIDDNDITTSCFKTKLLKEIYFLIKRQHAEIERLSTQLDQRNEMMANMGVELNKAQSLSEFYKERANKYEAQVEVLLEQTHKQRDEIERLNGSKSVGLEKVEHDSLCETETYDGGGSNG